VKGTLLSSALISVSNTNPQQTLSQWLEETEREVPELYKKLYQGQNDEDVQLPVLFDFTKHR
jgi:hypothetical protein